MMAQGLASTTVWSWMRLSARSQREDGFEAMPYPQEFASAEQARADLQTFLDRAAPALPSAATGASLLRAVPSRPDDEVVVPCPPHAWIVYRSRGTTSNGQVTAFIEQQEDTLNRLLRIA